MSLIIPLACEDFNSNAFEINRPHSEIEQSQCMNQLRDVINSGIVSDIVFLALSYKSFY